jgi:hypothetical protein
VPKEAPELTSRRHRLPPQTPTKPAVRQHHPLLHLLRPRHCRLRHLLEGTRTSSSVAVRPAAAQRTDRRRWPTAFVRALESIQTITLASELVREIAARPADPPVYGKSSTEPSGDTTSADDTTSAEPGSRLEMFSMNRSFCHVELAALRSTARGKYCVWVIDL